MTDFMLGLTGMVSITAFVILTARHLSPIRTGFACVALLVSIQVQTERAERNAKRETLEIVLRAIEKGMEKSAALTISHEEHRR